ncbi:MAG: hypothetical protein KDA92_25470, partial [Planctomycetales bacterium]|nr:hypothetical protein [Planctomycetales bacterium]
PFAFDNLTHPDKDEEAFEVGHFVGARREVLLSRAIETLAPEPILAGYAKPGTVLIGRLYAEDGSVVAETNVTANAAGNWVMQFFGTKQIVNTRVIIEHVATENVELGATDFKLTDDTYRSLQLDAEHDRALTPGTILADAPSTSMEVQHRQYLNPLSLLN